jgi:large subunit ribosomal protein L3
MAIGLVGRKCGMTRVFTEAGDSVPVTVVELLPNRVTQVKTEERDGYRAVQVTYGERRPQLLSKAIAGHYAKSSVAPGRALIEFRLAKAEGADLQPGTELKVDRFSAGQAVDVTGVTIGKGFAGVMKRHNFAGGYASHGHSVSHRVPGSIGQRQTPGRVFPGKRMSGHMGVMRRTTENLKIVGVDTARNLLLISGAVPGGKGGQVVVRPSVKAARMTRRKSVAPSKAAASSSAAKKQP